MGYYIVPDITDEAVVCQKPCQHKDCKATRSRIVLIEKHSLSDGGLAIINQLGRSYSFTRTYDSVERPPDVTFRISKETAYKLLADTLQNDVCEVD